VVSDAVLTIAGHTPMDLRTYLAANPRALAHLTAPG
jgi:hypothetical protein